MNETTPCPICYSENPRFLFEGWDLTFAYPDSAWVYQCRNCGHVFVAGELTPEQLTDMYTNYYPRSNFDVEDYKPHEEKSGFFYWLDGEEGCAYRHVPKNVRVLDIGCGHSESLGYHKARGCEVYGVEADENVQKIADRYGFNVEIGLFDPAKYESQSFDYVTADYVLEHVVDPLTFLREIHKVLKPGGKFIASFPNPKAFGRFFFGRYWHAWHLPFHRHFYTKRSLEILAEQSGYEIEMFKSVTESFWLLMNWSVLFYYSKSKGQQAPAPLRSFGRFDTNLKKRWDVKLYLFLRKIRFLCLSMRIADMFGRGDNNILILRKTRDEGCV